jgi:5-methylcytosine-specific restriction protein A
LIRDESPNSNEQDAFSEEIFEEDKYYEGAIKQIKINRYERDLEARNKCIAHYGLSCCICGFNFEKKYGSLGEGFIHVHHLKPLSEIRCEYKLEPIQDLRPVCPNCHALIHRRRPPYSIEENLKALNQS